MDAPLLDLVSAKDFETLAGAVEAAVPAHGFSVLGMHDLGAKLREKGQSYDGQCRVFEVCNARQAARVLGERPDLSTALPCRISVYTAADGESHVATLLPTALGGLFDSPQLAEVATEVEAALDAILRDAAG